MNSRIVTRSRTSNYGLIYLHAGQPVNADCAACGVAPELDELLDGEDTSQVLDRSAVLGMASLELVVSEWVAGDPSDVGNADDVAVQVSLENTGAASWAASIRPSSSPASAVAICRILWS